MSTFRVGQEVEVYYEGKAGVKLWLNARIKEVHVNYICVKYLDKIPNYKKSDSRIAWDENIASKLRPKQKIVPVKKPAAKIETAQFEKDQQVSFKYIGKWIPATINYVGTRASFIRVVFMDEYGKEATDTVHQYAYPDTIRVISPNELDNQSSECKDKDNDNDSAETGNVKMDTDTDGTNEADGNESDEVGLQADPPVSAAAQQNDKAPASTATDPMVVDSNEATLDNGAKGGKAGKGGKGGKGGNGANGAKDGKGTNWNPLKTVYNYVTGSGSAEEPVKAAPAKRKRQWNQKAMRDWSHKDVISWINSLKSSENYCPNKFPSSVDGKELLEMEQNDLTLIIINPMFRMIFMQLLEKAKTEYKIAAVLNEEEYEMDDDYKEISNRSVNGVVGLYNQGNTCYMNTSIQILSQSPFITRYLAKRAKLKTHGHYPMLNGWTSLCDVIYNQASSGYGNKTVTPRAIRDALKRIDPEFGSGAQDDSSRSLGYMLQALDKDMDEEINQSDILSKCSIELQPGAALTATEANKYASRLIAEHNPPQIDSVLKKAFDGIEHVTCECLECNQVYQRFAVFRIVDLPVHSNQIQLSKIHVVCNDKYYPEFPEISALGHCSVDVLRYHATEYLSQFMSKGISDYHWDIICVSSQGVVRDISGDRISDLQNMDGTVFVLINTKKVSSNKTSCMLQLGLCVNKNGDGAQVLRNKDRDLCISYRKYNQNSIYKLIQSQKAAYETMMDDDQKCDWYINYNDNIFSMKELEMYGVDPDIHNDGINKLLLFRVNPRLDEYGYDINRINEKLLGEAEDEYSTGSLLKKLEEYKKKKIRNRKNHKTKGRYERIKEAVDAEIADIEQTIEVFKAKQQILNISSRFLSPKAKVKASAVGLLRTLTECIAEYQKPQILDESAYEHPCPCKGGSRNSDWVRYKKSIVYSPPIFLFHLDRYGKNMTDNYTSYRSSKSSGSYSKGQSVLVKWRNGQFFMATIVQKNKNKMKIRWSDNDKEEWVHKSDYSTNVRHLSSSSSSSNKGYGGYSGHYNNYGGNKYSHGISYNMNLACDKRYQLYGVSNHSGSTNGGHYTATVYCRKKGKWYDISDSSVRSTDSRSAISHAQSATILAYFRKHKNLKE